MQEKEAMNLTNPRKLKVTKSLARFPFSLTFNNLSHQPNITTKLDLTDSHTYTENPRCTYGRYTPTSIGRLLNNETKEPNRKDRERERERERERKWVLPRRVSSSSSSSPSPVGTISNDNYLNS